MCDTLARVGPDGTIFAKNSDRPRDEVQLLVWSPGRPAGGEMRTQYLTLPDPGAHGVLLSQPTWLWGAEHGVNEHGVAIGNERVYARRSLDDEPALIGMDLVRLGLERGATADEALAAMVELLEAHGQGGSCRQDTNDPYDSSFLITDAHGGWVLETCGRSWAAMPIGAGTSISNRYSIGDSWTRASADVPAGTSTHDWHDDRVDLRRADHRLAATRSCVAHTDGLDPATAVSALRDHGRGRWGRPGTADHPHPPPTEAGDDFSGFTVCMHGDWAATTTASMVVSLPRAGAPTVWACAGSPCVGTYRRIDDLAAPPAELTDADAWKRAAARRDAVEQDPGRLAAIAAGRVDDERAAFA
ncbi:MAG: hypothetical protein R8F63_17115 [Acidimicrobiales bacterium]|nr:hypothetical protein [Acidimicrobiales bacterium]